MKFLHLADVHIGAEPDKGFVWSGERSREIVESFNHVIDICNEQEVDLLLIAGDLFHRQPLVRELKEVNYRFSCLTCTRVVLIAGNHDYVSARSPYNGFKWNENVAMLFSEEMDSVFFEDLNTEVYGFSYHTREILTPRYDGVVPKSPERINILLAHGGTPRTVPIDRSRLADAGFDYVALGHYHTRTTINERVRYTGSFEPLDKNETGERGYIIGELGEKTSGLAAINAEFVPCSVRRYILNEIKADSDTTTGMLDDEIQKVIRREGDINIFRFRLTGFRSPETIFDTDALMKRGNIVEVTDETVPDYDFDRLEEENRDNIIGMYIERIRQQAGDSEISEKALYYGLEALLAQKI